MHLLTRTCLRLCTNDYYTGHVAIAWRTLWAEMLPKPVTELTVLPLYLDEKRW